MSASSCSATTAAYQRGRHRQAHRRHRRRAGRPRPAGPRRRCARRADRRQGPADRRHPRARRGQGAGHRPAPLGARAGADRAQGHRRAGADRARPARADHRRSSDRQDRRRDRHHPQPKADQRRHRRKGQALLHLCRDRPEALDRRPDRQDIAGLRRARILDRRGRDRLRAGAAAVHRALCRLRDGRVFPRQRHARADDLRRSVEAGRGLSPDVAAVAPPARPRGLSRRRVLSAFAAARTRRQDERRARRRLADRAAGHRDAGRRRVGLYPDQRDLDHRRPDLSRDRAVLSGHSSGHQCRPVGQPRRLGGADQGDEAGRRAHQARTGAVPRDGGLFAIRLRSRCVDAAPAGARQPIDRDC